MQRRQFQLHSRLQARHQYQRRVLNQAPAEGGPKVGNPACLMLHYEALLLRSLSRREQEDLVGHLNQSLLFHWETQSAAAGRQKRHLLYRGKSIGPCQPHLLPFCVNGVAVKLSFTTWIRYDATSPWCTAGKRHLFVVGGNAREARKAPPLTSSLMYLRFVHTLRRSISYLSVGIPVMARRTMVLLING